MNKFSVPGVYVSEQKYVLNPLQIDTRCLCAFAGIAEKGPIGTPILIKSFDEYLKIYGGFDTEGVLPLSIYSFFKCGGKECVITRIAHKESAKEAELELECQKGAVKLKALTPGVWGNSICVKLWYEYEKLPVRILNICNTHEYIDLDNVNDIAEGDIIDFNLKSGNPICRQVSKIDGKRIYFSYPLKILKKYVNCKEEINIRKVFFSTIVSNKDKKNETYLHLSMNENSERYFETYINDRSRTFKISKNSAQGMIKPVYSQYAKNGCDGITDLTVGDFIGFYKGIDEFYGIGSFESRDDISLIAVPDLNRILFRSGKSDYDGLKDFEAVQKALIIHAERFPNRFAILDMPDFFDVNEAIAYSSRICSNSAAVYYPYINVIDPFDSSGLRTLRMPPSGAVCGCIGMTDNVKGIFHAPANCIIQGSVGLSKRITQNEMELLYGKNINVLRYFPGSGVKIWGAKTLASEHDWRYISVRRTFSKISAAIKNGTQWAVFEINDKNLRKRLVRQVSAFLLDLWMKGYLAGSTAEQGFYVRCDEELNPIENIDNGILTFEVGVAIVKPAEFFQVTITAEKDGASVYIRED